MTATTEEPAVTLRLWADGTGEVIVEGVAAPISAGALRAARAQGLAQVQQLAARAGEPVRFVSYDPEGRWQLVMAPDGQVSEDNGSSAAPEAAMEERGRGAADEPEATEPAERGPSSRSRRRDAGHELVAGRARAAPAAKQRPYDSEYVMGSIVPVTRVPKSTRGWRGDAGHRSREAGAGGAGGPGCGLPDVRAAGDHRGRRPARRVRQDHHLAAAGRGVRHRARRRRPRPGEPRAARHDAPAHRGAGRGDATSAT